MRHAAREAVRMINWVPCEHKIGMCRCPYDRWQLYWQPKSRFKPWLLCLLATTATREGAFYLEACLIMQLESRDINMANNYNWTTSCDYGGEGPKPEEDALAEHFVYLAVIPLPLNRGSLYG